MDINKVTAEELGRVCQIDGEHAASFLQKRDELGGFASWEQIKDEVVSFDASMLKRLKKAGYGFGSAPQNAETNRKGAAL
jgi:DNA uptake protein ComE-like DNA-binding protein